MDDNLSSFGVLGSERKSKDNIEINMRQCSRGTRNQMLGVFCVMLSVCPLYCPSHFTDFLSASQ